MSADDDRASSPPTPDDLRACGVGVWEDVHIQLVARRAVRGMEDIIDAVAQGRGFDASLILAAWRRAAKETA